ncbi:MAG: hypothetical protein AAF649_06835, partial [Verrucomicrobiota bacterium]
LNRASTASTETASLNGRLMTPERWNKPLLMQANSLADPTPPSNFPAPDWILMARDGSNPSGNNIADIQWTTDGDGSQTVVGRYAFTIYNQGGLLDANVAGYSSNAVAALSGTNISNPVSVKPGTAYADLTQIGLTQNTHVDRLVQWRNEATISATNPTASFFEWATRNAYGFLRPANQLLAGTQSDRQFVSRQQLIEFFDDDLDAGGNNAVLDALQYLGTFNRTRNQPSFYRMQGEDNSLPNYDSGVNTVETFQTGTSSELSSNIGNSGHNAETLINPILASITVPDPSSFPVSSDGRRFDGAPFEAGEPLLKKRFPLSRLAWVTYKGPSANVSTSDPLILELLDEGFTQEYLNLGTAENIRKAFGLTWSPGSGPGGLGGFWTYDRVAAHNAPSASNAINNLYDDQNAGLGVANQGREPDFFELIKATVHTGAIGRSLRPSQFLNGWESMLNFSSDIHRRINNHIIQIGANIIDQADPDNYPTQIVFQDDAFASQNRFMSFWGVEDLPYWYGMTIMNVILDEPQNPRPEMGNGKAAMPDRTLIGGLLQDPLTAEQEGQGVAMQVPYVWNPHKEPSATLDPNLSPEYLRITVTTATPDAWGSVGQRDGFTVMLESVGSGFNSMQKDSSGNDIELETYWDQDENGIPLVQRNDVTGTIDFSGEPATALYFNRTNSNVPDLHRQPTPLMIPDPSPDRTPGNGRQHTGLFINNTNLLVTAGGLNRDIGAVEDVTGNSFVGFYMGGPYKLRWLDSDSSSTYAHTANRLSDPGSAWNGRGFTYTLQYSTNPGSFSNNDWVTYKQIFIPYNAVQADGTGDPGMPVGHAVIPGENHPLQAPLLDPANPSFTFAGNKNNKRVGSIAVDPRTNRFVPGHRAMLPGFLNAGSRPDYPLLTDRPGSGLDQTHTNKGEYKGAVSKNNGMGSGSSNVIVDSDGVLRRTMGGYVPDLKATFADTTVGIPTVTLNPSNLNEQYNRPVMLNRPFRTVGELGHVFTDIPWKNIDFFSPESGWTGFLDVFCINEDLNNNPVIAGKVDLNTRQAPVLAAILNGAYRADENGLAPSVPGDPISSTDATALADALVNRTTDLTTAGKGPLLNLADLVGRYSPGASNNLFDAAPYDGFSIDLAVSGSATGANPDPRNIVQRLREAPIRALAAAGQAGTWNLMIDLVTQTGKYPVTATDVNDFLVEAEKRIWLHVAIDRLTGEVIDQEIEVVTE